MRNRTLATLLFVAGALLAGCASTKLVDSWRDPAYTGPKVSKVMVIGVSRSDANRRVFEDGFVGALAASGSSGAPSYPVMPVASGATNAQVNDAARSMGADAVLVTRVLRVARNVDVRPGYVSPGFYGGGFRGYYGAAWVGMPPDVDVYDVLTVESTLWNMATDKPLWSGTSEVTDPGSVSRSTAELAKILVTRMKADGVL